jgi:hypothetical protein
MVMRDVAKAYVRYMTEGAEEDSWAVEELTELAQEHPQRAWAEIQRINKLPINGVEWQKSVYAAVGCGPLEELLVRHEASMLPIVIAAAKDDAVLQQELSVIYVSSVSASIWAAIRGVAQQAAARDRAKRGA